MTGKIRWLAVAGIAIMVGAAWPNDVPVRGTKLVVVERLGGSWPGTTACVRDPP